MDAPSPTAHEPGTKRHRPALIILVILAALTCLAMAWWQWDRYESSSGTFQNLGYALQWPAFAVAVVYAYRRFVTMEADPEEAHKAASGTSRGPTEIPEGILPSRPNAADPAVAALRDAPDATLTEYNRYLADLDELAKPHRSQPKDA